MTAAAHVIDDSHQTADGRRWPCPTAPRQLALDLAPDEAEVS